MPRTAFRNVTTVVVAEQQVNDNDRLTGYRLLEVGVAIPFRLCREQIESGPDDAEFAVRLELKLECDEEGFDVEDIVETGAFGFMFALAVLSFNDARPRESSAIDYREQDEFSVADFVACLSFRRGALHFYGDYIRGRRMKTQIEVRADGAVTLNAVGRGKSPLRWLDRLQGKQAMSIVGGTSEGAPEV